MNLKLYLIIFLLFNSIYLYNTLIQTSEIPHNNKLQTFGDSMANRGEINNIWKPIVAEINLIFLLGTIVSLKTNKSIFIIPIYYLFANIVFYFWHLYAHHSNGIVHEKHMIHHREYFKHDDFYGDSIDFIKKNYNDKTPKFMDLIVNPQNSITLDFTHDESLIFMLFVIIVVGKYYYKIDDVTNIACFIIFTGAVIFQIAIHTAYHIRNIELEKYAWFRELRSLHYNHHSHKKNFSMINMLVDVLFNSLLI